MNAEEKILEMLERQETLLEKQGEMLEKQGALLEKHSEMLGQITGRLDQTDGRMDQMQEDLSDLRTTVTRVAVTRENTVIPQLKLLAEGHETSLDTLSPRTRTEALEEDMALMKAAFKAMSQRIDALEKVQ